jgi:hypothetical protein
VFLRSSAELVMMIIVFPQKKVRGEGGRGDVEDPVERVE